MNQRLGKILIVDDEQKIRSSLAFNLKEEGFYILEAESCRTALELVKKNNIDIVLTDVRMPGESGIELLDQLKRGNPNKPAVIMMTGFSDLNPEEVYDLGAEAMILKPLELTELKAIVAKILAPIEKRLSKPLDDFATVANYKDHFKSLATAYEKGGLTLGRGGLFLPLPTITPKIHENLKFSFAFDEGPIKTLNGMGSVVWVRHQESANLPAGVGLEFIALAKETSSALAKYFSESLHKAFIPLR